MILEWLGALCISLYVILGKDDLTLVKLIRTIILCVGIVILAGAVVNG